MGGGRGGVDDGAQHKHRTRPTRARCTSRSTRARAQSIAASSIARRLSPPYLPCIFPCPSRHQLTSIGDPCPNPACPKPATPATLQNIAGGGVVLVCPAALFADAKLPPYTASQLPMPAPSSSRLIYASVWCDRNRVSRLRDDVGGERVCVWGDVCEKNLEGLSIMICA